MCGVKRELKACFVPYMLAMIYEIAYTLDGKNR
jgi:hypothetical protein